MRYTPFVILLFYKKIIAFFSDGIDNDIMIFDYINNLLYYPFPICA